MRREIQFDWLRLGPLGKVVPFVGIGFVVIQFFTTVGIPYIAIALGTNCMIVLALRDDGDSVGLTQGFVNQVDKAVSFETLGGRFQVAQVDQRWVKVH